MAAFSTQKPVCTGVSHGTCDNQDSNKRNAPYFGVGYPLKSFKNMYFVLYFQCEYGYCFYTLFPAYVKYGK
jgi:hypothetical protein